MYQEGQEPACHACKLSSDISKNAVLINTVKGYCDIVLHASMEGAWALK